MPPDCLAWQPGSVFVYGGFDGYGMTRRNVVYLPIYSRFQSTCHIRGMTHCVTAHKMIKLFQSTCHIRGMTPETDPYGLVTKFQSTCHIRGMTGTDVKPDVKPGISIHMPHTWHDPRPLRSRPVSPIFQSTCHIRGMTPDDSHRFTKGAISIHMPHTWHDEAGRVVEPLAC